MKTLREAFPDITSPTLKHRCTWNSASSWRRFLSEGFTWRVVAKIYAQAATPAPAPKQRVTKQQPKAEATATKPAEEDPAAAVVKEEEALVDWVRLICTLCKRQLKDKATLAKHVEASDLHQANLLKWREARAKQ